MPTAPSVPPASPLAKLLSAGATAVKIVNVARGLLPGRSRGSALMAFGGGALVGAGVGALGVALIVPEVRRALLGRASSVADQIRSRAAEPKGPPAPRTVAKAPRPRPQKFYDDLPQTLRPSSIS